MAQGLFFTYFDDHKGQSLLWSRTKDTQNLDGIELQALPSGLHLVERDTYYFRRTDPSPSSSLHEGRKSQLGTVVYRNRELSPEEVERAGGEGMTRGRVMIGLGVLSRIQDTNVHFPSIQPLQQAIDLISETWKVEHAANERKAWLDGILEPVWEFMRQDQSSEDGTAGEVQTDDVYNGMEISRALGVTPDNPIESLALLSHTLGVSLLSLWKYAAAGRRILFYGSPPLTSICHAAYCTWLLSLRLSALEQRPISVYLGMIGLTDMSDAASMTHGWVACTSDAIYKEKTGIYDLLVDCSGSDILPSGDDESVNTAREPVMRAVVRENGQVSLKYLTYTYSDTVLWNAISPLLSDSTDGEKLDPPHGSIWSSALGTYTYICDICWGLCAFATGTAYGHSEGHADHHAGGCIRLPTDDRAATGSSDGDSIAEDDFQDPTDMSDPPNTRMSRAIQILKILDHRRDHIEKRLSQSVADTGATSLSNEDMRKMGLSAWSWVDVEFVRGLHRLRRTEPVSTGTLGPGLEVEKGWFRRVIGIVGL